MINFSEEEIKEKAKPQILRCRAGDWNHACRVVEYVKKLGNGREDLHLIITAAYIHDIGWKDILPNKKISFDELLKFEKIANSNSELFAKTFLQDINYSEKDISIILKLIHAADEHKSNSEDEMIIVDADNLSKLSINHLKEKYKKSEWTKMYEMWKKEFPNRIKTKIGKVLFPNLLDKLKIEIS